MSAGQFRYRSTPEARNQHIGFLAASAPGIWLVQDDLRRRETPVLTITASDLQVAVMGYLDSEVSYAALCEYARWSADRLHDDAARSLHVQLMVVITDDHAGELSAADRVVRLSDLLQ